MRYTSLSNRMFTERRGPLIAGQMSAAERRGGAADRRRLRRGLRRPSTVALPRALRLASSDAACPALIGILLSYAWASSTASERLVGWPSGTTRPTFAHGCASRAGIRARARTKLLRTRMHLHCNYNGTTKHKCCCGLQLLYQHEGNDRMSPITYMISPHEVPP